MDNEERVILENRLTKMEGALEKIASTLDLIVEKFSGHTHPELERDFQEVKKDVNNVGQKCERIRLDTEEKLREMEINLKEQESINIKQEMYLEQIKQASTRFWTVLTGVIVVTLSGVGVFLFDLYRSTGK